MKNLKIALALGVIGIGGVVMFMASSGSHKKDVNPLLRKKENPTVITGTPFKRVPVLPTMDARLGTFSEDSSIVGGSSESPAVAHTSDVWDKFTYKTELSDYRVLRSKIFPSEEDKAFRRKFVSDEKVLRSLQELLQTPALESSSVQMQDAALDVLYEAFQASPNGAAAEVLKAVVSSSLVEDKSINIESRKALAGVKAEILFQMSSMNPGVAKELERLLPGPVSQQLWSNVKTQQQSNLAESALEK